MASETRMVAAIGFPPLGGFRLQVRKVTLSWACGKHILIVGCCRGSESLSCHHTCRQCMLCAAQLKRNCGDNEGIQQQQLQISHEHAQGKGKNVKAKTKLQQRQVGVQSLSTKRHQ